jgi:DMSO/TMAO reductase YedYZ molybdopterin-dependent catalytic subunit
MSGARLSDVLTKSSVQAGATQAVFYGRDGYAESVPLTDALDRGLLVYAMNGVLLPDDHGAPLKVEVPGLYGFRNMKWLTRIALVATPFQSVWIQEGWTALDYKTMSRIDAITANPSGGATIAGIAFAGLRGIKSVEVQINGGAWQAAILHTPPISDKSWTQWRLDILQRGQLTVIVRATDGSGVAQISDDHGQFPDGATGLHHVTIQL